MSPTHADLLQLAKDATNGWACAARTSREHADIWRLREAIRDIEAADLASPERDLTHELLDLITLPPDSQTDEIAVYIIVLRHTRKRSCAAIEAALSASPEAREGAVETAIGKAAVQQLERLALCPDHRDKAIGVCIVCQAEKRTREELRAEGEALRGWQTCSVEAKNGEGCGFQWRGQYVDCPSCTLTAAVKGFAARCEAAEAVAKYAAHDDGCDAYLGTAGETPCTCRLDAALKAQR
jgi:GNAT superfamily N-acetyltransferase